MLYRYTPLLRWKRGEKVALKKLNQGGRQDVTPLILLGTQRYVGKKATKSGPAIPPANAFANDMKDVWATAPFYLDATMISVTSNGNHPLAEIAESARTAGLQLIPATRLGAPALYSQAVYSLVQIDQRGVGLRLDLQGFTSASTWIDAWPHALSETDLLVDFTDNVSTVLALGDSLDHAFETLHGAGSWRSVTVIGTSMPNTFAGYETGLHQISRKEIQLWTRLCALALSFKIDYGDYATVPTTPPPEGIAWGFPINVRYTLADRFLICRGVPTTGYVGVDMDQQLVGHAHRISQYGNRGPLAHCWADSEIDEIATGSKGPGNLERWVQIGVNRHIELTRNNLP